MEKLKISRLFLSAWLISCLCGCSALSNVEDDARQTPIGSVMTGETTDASGYVRRVSESNRASDRDTWRPQSNERF